MLRIMRRSLSHDILNIIILLRMLQTALEGIKIHNENANPSLGIEFVNRRVTKQSVNGSFGRINQSINQ